MKKQLAFVLSAVLCMGLFTGCGKDVLEKSGHYICDEYGGLISAWYQFEDGTFCDVPTSAEGIYKINDDNTLTIEFTEGPERFKSFSGQYSYSLFEEYPDGIYVETLSELAQLDRIALLAEADMLNAMEADGRDLSSDSNALICSDKSKSTGVESLVWENSDENAADELYSYIEEALAEYEKLDYVLRIEGGGLMNLLVAEGYDNMLTGSSPKTGCKYYLDTENGYEAVELEGELTLDTACKFFTNEIVLKK